jgi:hypothetical protein
LPVAVVSVRFEWAIASLKNIGNSPLPAQTP